MDFTVSLLRGVLGIAALLGFAYAFSANRKAINWGLVAKGIGIQILLGILILQGDKIGFSLFGHWISLGFIKEIFAWLASFFVNIQRWTDYGSGFVFGDLMSTGFIFAVRVLPTIIFFSAISAALYYLGILQVIIKGLAWVMSRVLNISGAESLAAAANVFIGQTEAPLIVKPYLEKMSKSELLCLMTGGMATIAGGVFAAFVGFLGGDDTVAQQNFATHLLTASIMSAPAAIVAAKILYPETNKELDTNLNLSREEVGDSLLGAIVQGCTDGLKLAANVAIMLIVFMAFVMMFNEALMATVGRIGGLNEYVVESTGGRFEGFNFNYVIGMLFAPIAWILGVASQDILIVGQLLGKKTVINEFVAYADLKTLKDGLQYKSLIISTYALCGFANFASIGIQIGGIGSIAPGRKKDLAAFGIKALIGGTIACFLTAAIAGVIAGQPPAM